MKRPVNFITLVCKARIPSHSETLRFEPLDVIVPVGGGLSGQADMYPLT